MTGRPALAWVLPAALGSFIVAALAGVLYRYGVVAGFPFELRPDNVRHAHSHLMYFSWVTPLLMALIAVALPGLIPRARGTRSSNGAAFACALAIGLGLLAFVPFLFYGYGLAPIGGKELPASMIAAGLNVIPWYVFAVWYVLRTRGQLRTVALHLFDGAVVFLVLSSFGAWLLAAVSVGGEGSLLLERSALHMFLDFFSEGWLVLGVLGLIHARMPGADSPAAQWGTRLMLAGLPAIFLMTIPASLVPASLRVAAGVGGLMVAAGALLHVRELWPRANAWRVVLALLALKAIGTGAYSLPLIGEWVASQGLRLVYLHILLLGVVTLALLRASSETWYRGKLGGLGAMAATVFALLLSLVPLTRMWPVEWMGRWTLILAAAVAVLPVLAAVRILASSLGSLATPPARRYRRRHPHHSHVGAG